MISLIGSERDIHVHLSLKKSTTLGVKQKREFGD